MIQSGKGTVSSNSIHFNFATLRRSSMDHVSEECYLCQDVLPVGIDINIIRGIATLRRSAMAQVFGRAYGPMYVIDPIEGQFYANATDEDFRTGIDNNPYYLSDGTPVASNSLCLSTQAAAVWNSTTDG